MQTSHGSASGELLATASASSSPRRRRQSNLTEDQLLDRGFTSPVKRKAYPQLRRNDYIPLESRAFDEVVGGFNDRDARNFYKRCFGKLGRWFVPCLAGRRIFYLYQGFLAILSGHYAWCVWHHHHAWGLTGRDFLTYQEFLSFGCQRHADVMRCVWPAIPWLVIVAQNGIRSVLRHDKFLEMLAPTACSGVEGYSEPSSSDEDEDSGFVQPRLGHIKPGGSIKNLYTALYGKHDPNTNRHPKYWLTCDKMQRHLRKRFWLVNVLPGVCVLIGMMIAWGKRHYSWPLLYLGLPGAFVSWCALQVALLHIDFIAEVCANEIERLRLKMEVQWEGGLNWREIAGMHHYLDVALTAVSRMTSWTLFVGMCGVMLLAFVCLVGGLQSWSSNLQDSRDSQVNALVYFISLFTLSSLTLWTLAPMCRVTELCMCQSSDKTSLLLTASQHGHNYMELEARQEYNSFMLYIHNTIIGIELPGFGHLTYSFIFSKGVTLVSTIPILLTIFMGGGDQQQEVDTSLSPTSPLQ